MKDFDISILLLYMEGNASEAQQSEILAWLEESEENKRFFADYSANYYLHKTVSAPLFETERDRMMQRLSNRIDASEEKNEMPVRRFSFASAAVGFCSCMAVAAAILAAVILWPSTHETSLEKESLKYCYANSTTDTKSLILADGTKMFLKPGSEIEYDVTGDPAKRTIRLRGEAFFDVAADSLRPMFVETDILDLKVIGTAFSVRSQKSNCPAEVILERGCVQLMSPTGNPIVRMSPNQKATLSDAGSVVKIENIIATPYVIEQFNLETLENATIAQIIRRLERIYGVSIECKANNPANTYYFNFLKTDTVMEALEVVRQLTGEQCRLITKQ